MPKTAPLPTRLTESDAKAKRAPLWKVLFHNDDKTTMEFVVFVLMQFYGHSTESSIEIMLKIHDTGIGLAGTYPREIAELKQEQTVSAARTQKFPLQVTIEADE